MQRLGRGRRALGKDADHPDTHELGDLVEITLVIFVFLVQGLGIEAAGDGADAMQARKAIALLAGQGEDAPPGAMPINISTRARKRT